MGVRGDNAAWPTDSPHVALSVGFGLKALENEEKSWEYRDSLSWRTQEWRLLCFDLEGPSPIPSIQCHPSGDRLLTESHYGLCGVARVYPSEASLFFLLSYSMGAGSSSGLM